MAAPFTFDLTPGNLVLNKLDSTFALLFGAPAWVSPTLLNAWANAGGGFATVQYMQLPSGMVILKGSAMTGASGTIIFTLPAGLRPAATRVFPIVANTIAGFVTISTTGSIQVFGNPTISLDGVTFLGEV